MDAIGIQCLPMNVDSTGLHLLEDSRKMMSSALIIVGVTLTIIPLITSLWPDVSDLPTKTRLPQ